VCAFKCQVSAAARALFNLNAHYEAVFSDLVIKNVHLRGQHCCIHLLKFEKPQDD
jgi:hypothetical protein